MIVGISVGTSVEGLLIEQLCLQQVTHLRYACLIVVFRQAKVLCRLLDASLSNQEMLLSLGDVVPCLLYADLQLLSFILSFVESPLVFNILSFDSM